MNLGRISSAALMLSGAAGVIVPGRVGSALELTATSGRGLAETRAGLGGTYVALGAWALGSREPAADMAVGGAWPRAAGGRLGSLLLDPPPPTPAFWGYFRIEVCLGGGAVGSATRRA